MQSEKKRKITKDLDEDKRIEGLFKDYDYLPLSQV
jgi:hypothetical protein